MVRDGVLFIYQSWIQPTLSLNRYPSVPYPPLPQQGSHYFRIKFPDFSLMDFSRITISTYFHLFEPFLMCHGNECMRETTDWQLQLLGLSNFLTFPWFEVFSQIPRLFPDWKKWLIFQVFPDFQVEWEPCSAYFPSLISIFSCCDCICKFYNGKLGPWKG